MESREQLAAFIPVQASRLQLRNETLVPGEELAQMQQRLRDHINSRERGLNIKADAKLTELQQQLWKRAIKWLPGGPALGIVFLVLWRLTGWARFYQREPEPAAGPAARKVNTGLRRRGSAANP